MGADACLSSVCLLESGHLAKPLSTIGTIRQQFSCWLVREVLESPFRVSEGRKHAKAWTPNRAQVPIVRIANNQEPGRKCKVRFWPLTSTTTESSLIS